MTYKATYEEIDTSAQLREALRECEQLRAERDELQARIDGGVRVYAYEAFGTYKAHMDGKPNALLILDDEQ